MGSVNVNRNVTDAFYRYKMPRIQAKVEGKGNGIKTVIVNMTDVAKAIGRPPTYPTKFFGCELGAQTQFDFKNDRYIVNGSHDALKLQNLLDGFIKKFVLCSECENPETNLIINQKKQIISRGCKACGYQSMLDMKHKLTTFILKNPPDVNPAATGSSLATPSKGKSKKRKEAAKLSKTNGEDPTGSPDKGSDPEANIEGEDGEDDDWAVDVSQEAVMKRMQDLTEGAKNLTFTDDLEKTEKERVDIFYEFLQKKKRENGVVGAHKEILNESERLEIREKAPLVISEVLFDHDILQSIRAYRVLLLCFTHQNKRAQKALLGGVEQIINLQQDVLLPKVPHILKALYDNDIVEEEVFLDWGKKVSKKYVGKELASQIHAKAEPFLKWLEEAEEEEDSSDDESDVEIDYDDRLKATTLQEQPRPRDKDKSPPAEKQQNQKQEDEDEIDIDAI